MMKHQAITLVATVAAADLGRAVAFARQPVQRGHKIPVLETVLLRFEPGRLTVCGTDLDTHCEMSVEAECGAPFGFCVTPDHIASVARVAERARVEIALDADGACKIVAGDFSARFNAIIPDAVFPMLVSPEGDGVATAQIAEREINRMLGDTIPCISTEETRYYLNGVYMHAKEDGTLRAVATDGHRLALRRSDVAWPKALNGILPSRAAQIMHRATRGDGNATLTIAGTDLKQEVTPDSGDWRICYKLIDGTFPDYERVIPKVASTWSIPVSLGMIRRAMSFSSPGIFGRGSGHFLKFDLPAGKLSARPDADCEVSFRMFCTTGDVVVGFNGAYLRDFLRRNSPAVLRSNGDGNPALVETEDPDLTQVIMPVRL